MQAFEVEDARTGRRSGGNRSATHSSFGPGGRTQNAYGRGARQRVPWYRQRPELTKRSIIGYTCIVVMFSAVCVYFKNIRGGGHPPAMMTVSPRLKEIAEDIFAQFDLDGDSSLDVNDLCDAVALLGITFTHEQMQKEIAQFRKGDIEMGVTHSGLTKREFLRMLASLEIKANKEDLRYTFALLDRGHTGEISPSELLQAIAEVGQSANEDEVRGLVQECDNDHDGKLNLKEFKELVDRVMERSSATTKIIQRILSDMNMIVFYNRGLRKGGLVMVDGNTFDTKLYSFNDYGERTQLDVLTKCCDQAENLKLHGISALSYDQHICKAESKLKFYSDEHHGLENDDLQFIITQDEQRRLFAIKLLQRVVALHEHNKLCVKNKTDQCPQANNRLEVPIMGSAGMRMLPLTTNLIVWSSVCDQHNPSGGYRFASKGRMCGTIPGTEEAWYEYVSNIGRGISRRLTATLTIGVHSAQIAVPLLTHAEKEAFQLMIDAVKAKIGDCSGLSVNNGQDRIPIFNKGALEDPTECYRDFIEMKEPSSITLALEDHEEGGIDQLKAVGLISFMGVGSGNVAGGVQAADKWAASPGNNCGAADAGSSGDPSYKYDECKNKLETALREDWLFGNAQKFFKKTRLSVEHFTFASTKSMQAQQFLVEAAGGTWDKPKDAQSDADGDISKLGNDLLEKVKARCESEKKNSRWGPEGSMTCMSATYMALYLSSFFQNQDASKKIYFHPVNWIDGAYHQMLGKKRTLTGKRPGGAVQNSQHGGSHGFFGSFFP